jgi:hypothetical protein
LPANRNGPAGATQQVAEAPVGTASIRLTVPPGVSAKVARAFGPDSAMTS